MRGSWRDSLRLQFPETGDLACDVGGIRHHRGQSDHQAKEQAWGGGSARREWLRHKTEDTTRVNIPEKMFQLSKKARLPYLRLSNSVRNIYSLFTLGRMDEARLRIADCAGRLARRHFH
jgi:hypothetical protein